MNIPKHRNPSNQENGSRVATAPYNFIPLPDKIIPCEPLPDQDRYDLTRKSGYFEVTLTTKTLLYIRGLLTKTQFDRQENNLYADGEPLPTQGSPEFRRLVKNLPDFFNIQGEKKPVIPGSSLRGMLRQLIEIVTYSKVTQVSDKQMFFRTVDDTAIGLYYRGRMIKKNLHAGYMRRIGDEHFIYPCAMARISRDLLGDVDDLYEGPNAPNLTPRWSYQYQDIWVQLEGRNVTHHTFSKPSESGWIKAQLIMTGNMQGKKAEFVFYDLDKAQDPIPVPTDKIDRFHDDDQITQWQTKAFPQNDPKNNCRERPGMLQKNLVQEGDPVFYLWENDQFTFFGRARMFRLPYENRLIDLIPPKLRDQSEDAVVDMTDALFGFVRRKKSCAGRVFVTDATLSEPSDDLYDGIQIPKVLSNPRPTSFQHYLVQNRDHKDDLLHYDSNDNIQHHKTVIRGHKLYWHQSDTNYVETRSIKPKDTQHTQIKPLKSGHEFAFRVYFENLTLIELGAIAWVLCLSENGKYAHKLGMAKSLGLGSVVLQTNLTYTNVKSRYETLFKKDEPNQWCSGEEDGQALLQQAIGKFKTHMCHNLSIKGDFLETERIKMLLAMMTNPGPEPDLIKFMDWQGYKDRPILPDPLHLTGVVRSLDSSETRSNLDAEKQRQVEAKSTESASKKQERYYDKILNEPFPEPRKNKEDFNPIAQQLLDQMATSSESETRSRPKTSKRVKKKKRKKKKR